MGMIEYLEENDELICLLPANLDTAACDALGEELLARIAQTNQPVVFDMHRVEFVASSFLTLCLTACRHTGTEHFRIRGVKPMVRKVLDVTGLSRRFEIE
jgi:anti-anti-sigma factor